jgi:fatty-acyl-CoA synthase
MAGSTTACLRRRSACKATGGTTGAPKLTQASNEWLAMSTLAWATCWHFDAPPVNVAVTPVTHAAGCIALAQLQFGGATVFMETPELGQLLDIIESRHATTLFLPPTLIYALLAHPRLVPPTRRRCAT